MQESDLIVFVEFSLRCTCDRCAAFENYIIKQFRYCGICMWRLLLFQIESYHCVPMTAAQIKTMVNQLGTRQDTSELQDRLYVQIFSPIIFSDFSSFWCSSCFLWVFSLFAHQTDFWAWPFICCGPHFHISVKLSQIKCICMLEYLKLCIYTRTLLCFVD